MNWKRIFFSVLLISSFSIGIFLRTYDYRNRIAIENDNSRDAQVAQYASDHGKIVRIGQYSSAGPFFYSPWWYWILTILTYIPFGNLTLWYFSTFASVIFLFLIYQLGEMVGGEILGAFALCIAALAPSQIGVSVWNPSAVAYLSLLSLITYLQAYKTKRLLYYAITAFLISLAINIHLQSLLMLPVLAILAIQCRFSLKHFLALMIGFILAFVPLISFDAFHNWTNLGNFIYYLKVDQYNIYVPNRWLTYLFSYWPKTWSDMLGIPIHTGWIIIIAITVLLLYTLVKMKDKKIIWIAILFALELTLYRYYSGIRFPYLTLFAQPFVFLLTAWLMYKLYSRLSAIVIVLLAIYAFITIRSTVNAGEKKITYPRMINTISEIYQAYPGKNFDIYGCEFTEGGMIAHPVAFFIYKDGRSDMNGMKIGFCDVGRLEYFPFRAITLYDLQESKLKWYRKTTQHVYTDTVEW